MCWIGYETDKHIAKTDTRVFKMVYKKLKSWSWYTDAEPAVEYYPPLFPGMTYLIGKTFKVDIIDTEFRKRGQYISIDRGLHCYSDKCKIANGRAEVRVRHFATTLCHYGKWNGKYIPYTKNNTELELAVLECVIPSGTTYWENENGEIVTNTLKIIGERHI